MRACNVRICTEVDIKESSLCALEEDSLSCLLSLIGKNGNVVHVLSQTLTVADIFLDNCVKVDSLAAVNLCDDSILKLAHALSLFTEDVGVNQIVKSQTASLVLIHIGRADSTVSGSDVLIASELFGKSVKSDVPRHNDVRSGVDLQVIEGDPSLGEVVDLAEKILRVKNYACADKAEGVFIENT